MRVLLIPLDDTVLFPSMIATVAADVGDEERVFVVPRHGEGYAEVGTVAEVIETTHVAGAGAVATLGGLHRGIPGSALPGPDGRLRVEVTEVRDGTPRDERTRDADGCREPVVLEHRGGAEHVAGSNEDIAVQAGTDRRVRIQRRHGRALEH